MHRLRRFRFDTKERVALLPLMLMFFVANSAPTCPGTIDYKGGLLEYEFLVLQEGEQMAGFYSLFSGIEDGRLILPNGFGSPGAPIGTYRLDEDGDGFAEVIQALRARDATSAYWDVDGSGSYEAPIDPLFQWQDDRFFTLDNPNPSQLLPLGRHVITFENLRIVSDPAPPFDLGFAVQKITFLDQQPAGTFGGFLQENRVLAPQTRFLTHTPVGSFGSDPAQPATSVDMAIVTQILVNNAQDREQTVTMTFRAAATGDPSAVKIGATTSDVHVVNIPARTSLVFTLDPAGRNLETLWATVFATWPIGVATNFLTIEPGGSGGSNLAGAGSLPEGEVDAQAGIAASDLSLRHVLSVEKTASGFDTALALLNPTPATALIQISLVAATPPIRPSEPRLTGDEPVATAELALPSLTQTARFFTELLNIELDEFSGTIILDSDTDIAVTSLRTIDGKQASSLPGGTPFSN